MRLAVTTAGSRARRLIEAAQDATVIAVFARSLYLRDASGRIACFGGPGLGEGPLNALCVSWPESATVAANSAANWQAGVLRLGGVELDAAQAQPWRPMSSMAWDGPTLKCGLVRLAVIPARGLGRLIPLLVPQTAASGPSPPPGPMSAREVARTRLGGGEEGTPSRSDGEGEVVLCGPHSSDPPHPLPGSGGLRPRNEDWARAPSPPDRRRASRAPKGGEGYGSVAAQLEHALNTSLLTLAAWLREPAGEPPATVATLIGLGSGLTPAGDDALGGALIALRVFGRAALADRLAEWLLPRARTGTSDISHAHLAAAAEGEGAAALHDTLTALANDDASLAEGVARLDRIGHSSGWDALAGAVAALVSLAG